MNDEYLAEFEEADGYLNFASVGPASRTARRAACRIHDEIAAGGTTVDMLGPAYDGARNTIARVLGVPGDRATSVPTTSSGIMQVAFGLLGAGGNVVVASHEFPANLYPWLRAGRAGGPEVRLVDVPDRRVGPEALAPAIDAGTRLVALSLVDYLTGYRVDVEAVVAAAGDALVLVDGIQGLGAVAAGLGGADVFVAGGHKWLRAGFSTGVMAVSDRALERLEPTLSGWWAVQDNHDFEAPPPQPALDTADRFIEGSPNLPGALAAAAALEIVEREGIDTIERAVLERSEAVADVARSLGAGVFAPWKSDAERSGIATFRFGDVSSAAVVHGLAGEGFIVSERNGWIRVSPHATTPMRVIDEFADALAAQVRKA